MGPGCFAAAALASNSLLWLALCLRAWTAVLATPQKRTGKKAGHAGSKTAGQKGQQRRTSPEIDSGSNNLAIKGPVPCKADQKEEDTTKAIAASTKDGLNGDDAVNDALQALRSGVLQEAEKLQVSVVHAFATLCCTHDAM